MDDLFGSGAAATDSQPSAGSPLAARFRPRTLEEYIGQSHLLAPGKPLRRLIEADRLSSVILFGPPGAWEDLAGGGDRAPYLSPLRAAERRRGHRGRYAPRADCRRGAHEGDRQAHRPFIDEIHRFNKAQQDVLLPDVEAGSVRLIGATTHNPSFYINGPLVSRSQIFQLEPLSSAELSQLIDAALADPERGLGKLKVELARPRRGASHFHLGRRCAPRAERPGDRRADHAAG